MAPARRSPDILPAQSRRYLGWEEDEQIWSGTLASGLRLAL